MRTHIVSFHILSPSQASLLVHLFIEEGCDAAKIEELRAAALDDYIEEEPDIPAVRRRVEQGEKQEILQVPLIAVLRRAQMAGRLSRFVSFVCVTIILTITMYVLTGDANSRLKVGGVLGRRDQPRILLTLNAFKILWWYDGGVRLEPEGGIHKQTKILPILYHDRMRRFVSSSPPPPRSTRSSTTAS